MAKKFFKKTATLALFVMALFAIALIVMGCPSPDKKTESKGDGSFTVTFDKNGGDTDPIPDKIKVASTGRATVKFPETPPTWEGYKFTGYTLKADGTGAFMENGTQVKGDITLYAQWDDGKPKKVVDAEGRTTIVHNMPDFTLSSSITKNDDDTYKLTGPGNMDYLFPTNVDGEDANTYDYFIVLTQKLSGEDGAKTSIQIKTYGTTANYGGGGSPNKMPWLSNNDSRTIILEVSGAGTTKGFRIYVPETADYQNTTYKVEVEKLKISSITFYKLPRYTVTFDYNDNVTANTVVAEVKGSDENMKSPGVTAAKWPQNPANGENHFFIGWFDGSTVYTATTPITDNITLKAKWAETEPTGWMEQITTTGTSVPVYGFNIPVGGKLGDYTKVVVKLKAGNTDAKGRFRAWGPYAATGFATGGLGNAVTAATGPNMQNAVDGLLLTNTGDYTGSNGMSLSADSPWEEFELDISTDIIDPKYNGGTDGSGKTFFTDATGIQLLGIGIIANSGSSDSRTYYLKDLRLSNADGTKTLDVIDPKDPSLFSNEGGKTISVRQSGSDSTVRTRMYADD